MKILRQLHQAVSSRRRFLLTHNSLQNVMGLFFQRFNFSAEYEVPFHSGGFGAEKVIFDVVAERGKKVIVVEIKDTISSRDLGQIHGYADTLQINKFRAQLFLGTDVLNYDELINGTTGEMIKELMERENVGIILADKYFMILCQTYNQLVLVEMPEFWFSEEPVG